MVSTLRKRTTKIARPIAASAAATDDDGSDARPTATDGSDAFDAAATDGWIRPDATAFACAATDV